MANLKYRVDSGGELPAGQSHEDATEASIDGADALAYAGNQTPVFPSNRDLDRVQAERLIEEIEIAGSSCDVQSASDDNTAGVRDPGCMAPVAEDEQSLGAHPGRAASERAATDTFENRLDGQQWILPSMLVVLTIGLGIFFLVNFSEVGDHPRNAGGVGIPAGASRAELALDSTTRSKLAELNRRVIFWMSRNGEGFDPYSVTLKRVRDDLDLSSDQMLDSWGRPIRYEAADEGYTLRSSGPDKIFNTGDDLVELQPQVPSQMQPAKRRQPSHNHS